MTEKRSARVLRADKLPESIRKWCFSLALESSSFSTVYNTESANTDDVSSEISFKLSSASYGIILVESSVTDSKSSEMDFPHLPVLHEEEQPAPKKKRTSETTEDDTKSNGDDGTDKLLGFLLYDFDDIEMDPDEGFCAYIAEVHVRSEMRGKGIGGFLLSTLETIALNAGASCIKLTCSKKNTGALKFYFANSFDFDPDNPDEELDMPYVILRKTFAQRSDENQ